MTGRNAAGRPAALLLAAAALPLSLIAQEPVARAPRTAALAAGACQEVAEGDVLTLEWNPAFENPGVVTGLHDLTLSFLRSDQDRVNLRVGGGLKLQARPSRVGGVAGAENPVAALPNGFYQLRFRVHLNHVGAGEYHLAAASAEPEVAPDYTGPTPQMTNTPLHSPFCLTVALPQRGR